MIRFVPVALVLGILVPSLAAGQADSFGQTRDAVGIRARVIEGLSTPGEAEMIARMSVLLPSLLAQRTDGGALTLDDLDGLTEALRELGGTQPGVVISLAVVGPDGTAMRAVSGQASLPSWASSPTIGAAADSRGTEYGDVLRRDGGEYYLYVNVSACNV